MSKGGKGGSKQPSNQTKKPGENTDSHSPTTAAVAQVAAAVNAGAGVPGPVTMAELVPLLNQQREALASDIKSAFATLEKKLDGIKVSVVDQGERIVSLETNAELIDERLARLEAANAKLLKDNVWMKTKLSSLEGHSRRSNVRIVGVPESAEAGTQPTTFFSKMFVDVLGEQVLSSPPELCRAHRTSAAKPGRNDKPRSVLVCFHRFQLKELVMREARKRSSLTFNGHTVRFYEDYTADVLEQRGTYKTQMADLYKLGLRPSLLFPARLRITLPDGVRKWLPSPSEATDFIQNYEKDPNSGGAG